jgi:hypothetical protein
MAASLCPFTVCPFGSFYVISAMLSLCLIGGRHYNRPNGLWIDAENDLTLMNVNKFVSDISIVLGVFFKQLRA